MRSAWLAPRSSPFMRVRLAAGKRFHSPVPWSDRPLGAAELGDAAWTDVLTAHHARVRYELARFGGREMRTTGDGFFALFDGPARAIRCALAPVDALRLLGLEIRAGLHTGEVELVGDDVEGVAIHIGARIAGLAGTGEVLVSRTIKDLVVGSGLTFRDRGVYTLKGVPDQWQLFAAAIN